jgi:hypothetical protein
MAFYTAPPVAEPFANIESNMSRPHTQIMITVFFIGMMICSTWLLCFAVPSQNAMTFVNAIGALIKGQVVGTQALIGYLFAKVWWKDVHWGWYFITVLLMFSTINSIMITSFCATELDKMTQNALGNVTTVFAGTILAFILFDEEIKLLFVIFGFIAVCAMFGYMYNEQEQLVGSSSFLSDLSELAPESVENLKSWVSEMVSESSFSSSFESSSAQSVSSSACSNSLRSEASESLRVSTEDFM